MCLFWIKVGSSATPALCWEMEQAEMKDVFMQMCKHTQAWPSTLILMSGATEVRALLTQTGGLAVMCLMPMRWTLIDFTGDS